MEDSAESAIRNAILDIPDYPKKGIIFRDITPLLKDPRAFRMCIDGLAQQLRGMKIDYILGIESRGFIIGAALAYMLNAGFVPIRKEGKLPRDRIARLYELEYGSATLEMHRDAIERGSNVLIVDDLLATGGTAKAAAELATELGGKLLGFAFVIELLDLNGRKKLGKSRVISLVKY